MIGVVLAWPRLATETFAAVMRDIVWRVPTTRPFVALTFDDGPDPVYTPQILRILAEHHITATFFLIGERARAHPDIVAAIRKAGHEVGNHSDSRYPSVVLSAKRFEESLLRAQSTLALEDQGTKYFRPAGAWIRPAQVDSARRLGYTVVLGSAYGFDPYRPPTGFITWEIGRGLHPGAIIVLHDSGGNRQNSVDALPRIIQLAKTRSLAFTSLSQLLAEK